MKPCPTACGAEIPAERVMCSACWEKIPSERLREILYKLNRGGKEPAPGFAEALASAVEQVKTAPARRRILSVKRRNA